jgi:hypothetical protein
MTLRNGLRCLVAVGVLLVAGGAELWYQTLGRQMAAICAEAPQAAGVCAAFSQSLALGATLRLLQTFALLALMIWGVDLLLKHFVDVPAQTLRQHFRSMVLGQWRAPLPEAARRAPAGIPAAVVELGEELDNAFLQLESATRRASLALFVRNAEQRLERIAESVDGVSVVAEAARAHRQIVPQQALDNLKLVSRLIAEMRDAMDAGFAKELETAKKRPADAPGKAPVRRPRRNPLQVA